MKKMVLFLFLFSLWGIENTSANWYGPSLGTGPIVQNGYFIQAKTLNDGATNCLQDGDLTGGYPAVADWGTSPGTIGGGARKYDYDTRAWNHDANNMRCQRWDESLPESLNVTYTAGWTNADQVITVSAKDRGGSRLKRILLQESMNGAGWVSVAGGDWDNLGGANNTLITRNWTRTVAGQNGNTFRYRILAYDYSGNQNTFGNATLIRVDTQAPLASDIGNTTPANNSNLLAVGPTPFSLTVGINGGSPIVETTGYFEDRASAVGSYIATSFTSLSGNFSQNFDIRNVDLQRVNGGRVYSLKITRICDEAGNCTTTGNNSGNAAGIKNFTYNVYANTTNIGTKIITSNPITNVGNIADGSVDNIALRLLDAHGNIIIPVSTIGRNISFSTNITNNIRLNQYDLTTPDTALFTQILNGTGAVSLGTSTKTFGNKPSTNGTYTLPYYVFAPTTNASLLVSGNARVNNISFVITGNPGSAASQNITSSSFDIIARPLFTTQIDGNIRTQGLIEGASQTGSITVAKINGTATSNNNVYFEFGNYNAVSSLNEANLRYDIKLQGVTVREGVGSSFPASTNVGSLPLSAGTRTFTTQMLLQSGAVNTTTNSYLASLVSYQIGSPVKTVVYPQYVLGKDSYHGTTSTNNSYQAGVKIIGKTSSQNTQEITTNQFSNDVDILGVNSKTELRKKIQENVARSVKGIPSPVTTGNITNLSGTLWNTGVVGSSIENGAARYFLTNGGNITISGTNLAGNKTLIVEGGNIYINGDIRGTGILGLIALEKNGTGGNIYINPTVRDIHAVIYADRSLMSYDGIKEFDGNNSTASELANQLYIKGSIFSENTIGGSRRDPIACPYFENATCTLELAQKYDLNYLRRYFIFDSNGDGNVQPTIDSPANSGQRSLGGMIGSNYEQYPVIIDYNSKIQETPPPFFGK